MSLSGGPCQVQHPLPGGWAPLTQSPFAPRMPGGPRDPGGPCGEEKEFGEASFQVARATRKARSVGAKPGHSPQTGLAREWPLPGPRSLHIEGLGPAAKAIRWGEAAHKLYPRARVNGLGSTWWASSPPGEASGEEKPPWVDEPFPSVSQNQHPEAPMTFLTKGLPRFHFPGLPSNSKGNTAARVLSLTKPQLRHLLLSRRL